MEEYIADAQGRIPVSGHTATYPPGYRVYILHGAFAGMEPHEQVVESSALAPEQSAPVEPAQPEGTEEPSKDAEPVQTESAESTSQQQEA